MKKKLYSTFLILTLLSLLSVIPAFAANTSYTGYPTFSITVVVRDDTVSILGYNFPANDKFTVIIGNK